MHLTSQKAVLIAALSPCAPATHLPPYVDSYYHYQRVLRKTRNNEEVHWTYCFYCSAVGLGKWTYCLLLYKRTTTKVLKKDCYVSAFCCRHVVLRWKKWFHIWRRSWQEFPSKLILSAEVCQVCKDFVPILLLRGNQNEDASCPVNRETTAVLCMNIYRRGVVQILAQGTTMLVHSLPMKRWTGC